MKVGLLLATVFVLLIEIGCRTFFAAPSGYFSFLRRAADGALYPKNTIIKNSLGPIPYLVHTNNLGLRGADRSQIPASNTYRIVAIGDSITDGFYVEDDETWEDVLEKRFSNCEAAKVEVLNLARGGGSIIKERAILEQVALPLKPDLVVLSFVTNDIAELAKVSDLEALKTGFEFDLILNPTVWVLNTFALPELMLRTYLRMMLRDHSHESAMIGNSDKWRERIANNIDIFHKRYGQQDGLVLEETWENRTELLYKRYEYHLDAFRQDVDSSGSDLLLVFVPAYPQIYQDTTSDLIRQKLSATAAQLTIPFLDLTEGFRSVQSNQPLHFAPIDYHLSVEGNKIFAGILYQYLRQRSMGCS